MTGFWIMVFFYNPRSKALAALAESVVGSPIKLQSSIKNLGVYLDSTMSFDKQVSDTCEACFFHIRVLRHIRASLTAEASKTIAAAIVGAGLKFCNSPRLAHFFQIWLTFSLSRMLLLGRSHKNLGSAASHLFSLICIGFRFTTELALKLLRLAYFQGAIISASCISHPTISICTDASTPLFFIFVNMCSPT